MKPRLNHGGHCPPTGLLGAATEKFEPTNTQALDSRESVIPQPVRIDFMAKPWSPSPTSRAICPYGPPTCPDGKAPSLKSLSWNLRASNRPLKTSGNSTSLRHVAQLYRITQRA